MKRLSLRVLVALACVSGSSTSLAQVIVSARAMVIQGDSLLRAGESAAAEDLFRRALNTLPTLSRDTALLAAAHFGRALSSQQTLYAAGDSLSAQQVEDLARDYRAATALDSASYFASSYNNLGVLLIDAGRPAEALPLLRAAAATPHPSRAQFYSNAGRAYEALSLDDSAASAYRRSLALDSTDAASRQALLRVYRETAADDSLLALVARTLAVEAEAEACSEALTSILSRGIGRRRLRAQQAEMGLVLLVEAYALMRVEPTFYQRSLASRLDVIHRVHPQLRFGLYELREALRTLRVDGARIAVQGQWWRTTPDRRKAWSMLLKGIGDYYYWKRWNRTASAYYEAALARDSESSVLRAVDLEVAVPLFEVYTALQQMAKLDSLIGLLDRRGATTALDTGLASRLGDAYLAAGFELMDSSYYERAKAQYKKAIALNPTSATAFVNLGFVYAGTRQLDSSIAAFEHAVELDPLHPIAANNLGYALFHRGDSQRAVTYLQQAYRLRPSLLTAVNLGVAYRFAGDVQSAARWDREARIGMDTTTWTAFGYVGGAWLLNHKSLQPVAREISGEGVRVRTPAQKRAVVAHGLSLNEAMAGQLAQAEPLFAEAYRLAPDREFRCFFANEIQALMNRVTVSAGTHDWLRSKHSVLVEGITCPAS